MGATPLPIHIVVLRKQHTQRSCDPPILTRSFPLRPGLSSPPPLPQGRQVGRHRRRPAHTHRIRSRRLGTVSTVGLGTRIPRHDLCALPAYAHATVESCASTMRPELSCIAASAHAASHSIAFAVEHAMDGPPCTTRIRMTHDGVRMTHDGDGTARSRSQQRGHVRRGTSAVGTSAGTIGDTARAQ